jgi:hypothetical protein
MADREPLATQPLLIARHANPLDEKRKRLFTASRQSK